MLALRIIELPLIDGLPNPNQTPFEIDITPAERQQFADAQAGKG